MSLLPSSTRSLVDQLLDTVEIRSQVEQCVNDMITDVEFSSLLYEQVERERERSFLKQQLEEYQYAIDETRALHAHQQESNAAIADQLVIEMWNYSKTVGSLLRKEKDYEELLVKFDEMVAKLLLAEDEIAEAKLIISNADRRRELLAQPNANEQQRTTNDENPSRVSDETSNQANPTTISSDETPAAIPENSHEASDNSVTSNQKEENPVVELIEDENESTPLNLDQLETNILLHIFMYLDPLDVLNAAQINLAMYSRVDSLFNPTDVGDDQQTDEPKGLEPSAAPVEKSSGNDINNDPTNATSTSTNSTQSVEATTMSSSTPSTATVVPIPPVSIPLVATTSNSNTTGTVSTVSYSPTLAVTPTLPTSKVQPRAMDAPVTTTTSSMLPQTNTNSPIVTGGSTLSPRNVFSVLQPKLKPSPPGNQVNPTDAVAAQRTQPSSTVQPLNAAMATSMAAKLSDAELNAIIMMTERLKQKEQLAAQYKLEKEALAAKLDGTESVKQFLIAKVRDMEASLNQAFSNEKKAAEQYERDQEVIAFLDERVQELEREGDVLRLDKKNTIEELEQLRKQANEKSTVMSDMLQFEREKMQENEREWKATKKVLIKEVRSLRSQIATLQIERDSYRNEKESLARALSTSSSGFFPYNNLVSPSRFPK